MKEYRKGFSEKEVKILKRVDLLCDALEIDHLGLTNEALKKLMNDYNNINKSIELLKDKGVSKFLEFETGKKRIKEILEYPNEGIDPNIDNIKEVS